MLKWFFGWLAYECPRCASKETRVVNDFGYTECECFNCGKEWKQEDVEEAARKKRRQEAEDRYYRAHPERRGEG